MASNGSNSSGNGKHLAGGAWDQSDQSVLGSHCGDHVAVL